MSSRATHGSPAAKARKTRGRVGATRFDVTLEGLRQLLERFDQRQLEPDDWVFVRALIWNQLGRLGDHFPPARAAPT